MFAKTQGGGLNLGFPDVCNTPPVPEPVPYPNLALPEMAVAAVYNLIVDGAPAHNMGTEIPLTEGDEPGVALGVASGEVMGPSRDLTGAFTVLFGGMPATRLTSVSIQNSTNCPGVCIVPSQASVLLLAP
jgi:hypothetical protein